MNSPDKPQKPPFKSKTSYHTLKALNQIEADRTELIVALSNAIDGIAKFDADGICVNANSNYADMYGYKPDELVGKPWFITIAPTERNEVDSNRQKILATISAKGQFDCKSLRKDGTTFPSNISVVKLADDKHHYLFVQDLSLKPESSIGIKPVTNKLIYFIFGIILGAILVSLFKFFG